MKAAVVTSFTQPLKIQDRPVPTIDPMTEMPLSTVGKIGSAGTRQDLTEVFGLHALGRTTVVAEARRLDDVNAAIDEVLGGHATARLVFEL